MVDLVFGYVCLYLYEDEGRRRTDGVFSQQGVIGFDGICFASLFLLGLNCFLLLIKLVHGGKRGSNIGIELANEGFVATFIHEDADPFG